MEQPERPLQTAVVEAMEDPVAALIGAWPDRDLEGVEPLELLMAIYDGLALGLSEIARAIEDPWYFRPEPGARD